jgi:hypothetical protein
VPIGDTAEAGAMSEWGVFSTAVLVAGNVLGIALIVRPLLKTVGALAARPIIAAAFRYLPDLIVIDSNDRTVGHVIGFAPPPSLSPLIPRIVVVHGEYVAPLYVRPGFIFGDLMPQFKSADCTGNVYVNAAPHPPSQMLYESAVFDDFVYQAQPNAAPAGVTIRSVFDEHN